MSKESEWKKGPVEVAGEYWMYSDCDALVGEFVRPCWVLKGGGSDTCRCKLREAAPPRPEAEKEVGGDRAPLPVYAHEWTDVDEWISNAPDEVSKGKITLSDGVVVSWGQIAKPKIEPAEGRWYLIRWNSGGSLTFAKWIDGGFYTIDSLGPSDMSYEIICEIPGTEEYIKDTP